MGELSEEDAKLLQEGVMKHEQTTKTAREAAKIAQEARDAAQSTVAALHQQEVQMRKLDEQYAEVEGSVRRAEGLVAWLKASCCCTCFVREKRPLPAKSSNADAIKRPETATRMTLPEGVGKAKAKAALQPSTIGEGLGGHVEEHLKQQTNEQDGHLETIEDCLNDMELAARDMNAQLKRQEALEEGLARRNESARDKLNELRYKMKS